LPDVDIAASHYYYMPLPHYTPIIFISLPMPRLPLLNRQFATLMPFTFTPSLDWCMPFIFDIYIIEYHCHYAITLLLITYTLPLRHYWHWPLPFLFNISLAMPFRQPLATCHYAITLIFIIITLLIYWGVIFTLGLIVISTQYLFGTLLHFTIMLNIIIIIEFIY